MLLFLYQTPRGRSPVICSLQIRKLRLPEVPVQRARKSELGTESKLREPTTSPPPPSRMARTLGEARRSPICKIQSPLNSFSGNLACPAHWQMPTTPAAQIALSHGPKPPAPHSGQTDSKYPRNKVKERERHRKSSLLYIGEIALCAGSRCNIQNVEPRKEGTGGGDPLRSKVANKPKKKKKDGKSSSRKRHFFCKYHANRQLASLKRTPINNRIDTPSIPAHGLRAQGEKKPKCLLAFQDIWHSCDYI